MYIVHVCIYEVVESLYLLVRIDLVQVSTVDV